MLNVVNICLTSDIMEQRAREVGQDLKVILSMLVCQQGVPRVQGGRKKKKSRQQRKKEPRKKWNWRGRAERAGVKTLRNPHLQPPTK